MVGQLPDFLYSSRHEPAFYEALWQATVIRGSWQGDVWLRRKNGEDVRPHDQAGDGQQQQQHQSDAQSASALDNGQFMPVKFDDAKMKLIRQASKQATCPLPWPLG